MDLANRPVAARAAAVLVTVLGGVGLATQSRVNGQLGAHLRDGLVAALISFLVGLVILAVGVFVAPKARAAVPKVAQAVRERRLRPWQVLGGAAGAMFVTAQGLTVAALGVAMFTVAAVSGQVLSGLLMDRAGVGPGGPRPITPTRAVGAVLAVVAVTAAVSDEFDSPSRLWLSLIPAAAGLGLGWAQAVNGRVRAACGSVSVATLVNFGVGTAVLALACVVEVLVRGLPAGLPSNPILYVGGALGVIGVSASVFAVRYIGVLMVSLGMISGQIAGAVLFDLTGPGIEPATVVGVVVTLLAAGVASLPSGRPRKEPAAQ
ncbi:DMT family transporter [Actinokineospora terrae]|uniref:Transporter family-2 protein n=1 Tax=Actinokineospora terrae TaxID=155974 RepID=A0A1H9S442_9PSEU|nr:DMT family transporter [Actinokineospora terrae]SER79405.1 transporter family-2 protein [Actinokineospora terrae]